MKDTVEKPKKKKRIIIYLLLFTNITCIVVAIWLFRELQNKKIEIKIVKEKSEAFVVARDSLQMQLDALVIEHNKVKSQYGKLTKQLAKKDSLIGAQIKEIQNLIDNKVELKKVKKKMDALRRIAQDYVSRLDSLYTVSRELKDENVKIKENIKVEKEKNSELTKTKEDLSKKVNTAALLKVYKINGWGIKRKGGGKKEEVVKKARKADELKITFTILENQLAKAGPLDVYVRVAGPNERILTDGIDDNSRMFKYNGKDMQYSLKKHIYYENIAQDLTLYWKQKKDFEAGVYYVDVFTDSLQLGTGSFNLDK